MKKIIYLTTIFLGTIILSGCGQSNTSQTPADTQQSTNTVPVQSAVEQNNPGETDINKSISDYYNYNKQVVNPIVDRAIAEQSDAIKNKDASKAILSNNDYQDARNKLNSNYAPDEFYTSKKYELQAFDKEIEATQILIQGIQDNDQTAIEKSKALNAEANDLFLKVADETKKAQDSLKN